MIGLVYEGNYDMIINDKLRLIINWNGFIFILVFLLLLLCCIIIHYWYCVGEGYLGHWWGRISRPLVGEDNQGGGG